LLWKNTQVWENDVLMITGLHAYKTTGDALRALYRKPERRKTKDREIAVQVRRGEASIQALFNP
jgi:hypothetical protein